MLKLKIIEIITTTVIIPYFALAVYLMINGHWFLFALQTLIAAAVTIGIENLIKKVKHSPKR